MKSFIYGVDRRYIHVFSRFLGFLLTVSRTQHNIYLPVVFILDHISSFRPRFLQNGTLKALQDIWTFKLIFMSADSLNTSLVTTRLFLRNMDLWVSVAFFALSVIVITFEGSKNNQEENLLFIKFTLES